MAIKKSELYSSLWKSCDELRGGMDASQYKDYVLVLLFVKYVSDKYANQKDALIEVPVGGSFADMVVLKGDKEIGDKINKIISKLAEANGLRGVIDVADFNDEERLGSGKEMVDRLSNLVAIFDTPELDFRGNRTEGDDLLGDAYEYLMRHFATESGKSKGQFYTPAEVSRIMAQVIGIGTAKSADQTIYDPTCGSGSLLIKAHDEAKSLTGLDLAIYGQEMDNATVALAKMNMFLHDCATAEIWKDNTLSTPYFKTEGGRLKTHDFVVANPPFSTKAWSNGLDPANDLYGRFEYGIPPMKNGDYAFLLHILASLKSTGKGAVIMPHGVLFRGNAEASIRKQIVQRGYIKGIIGLPANLFYGTSIPACIIVLDKENAHVRKGIFMIDGSRGFMKDGNKNRLRAQDLHKIVDTFNRHVEISKYSRMVPLDEIEENEYNLNIPRYIDSTEAEDLQDIEAHLKGDIPNRDIDDLARYWKVLPSLKSTLFASSDRPHYSKLSVKVSEIKSIIFDHDEFTAFNHTVSGLFEMWKQSHINLLKGIEKGTSPKTLIGTLSEGLLESFRSAPLIEAYNVYQHLMDYWAENMQDDVYLIAAVGWEQAARLRSIVETKERQRKEQPDITIGKRKFKSDLIPVSLLIARYFVTEQVTIEAMEAELSTLEQQIVELKDEHGGEGGLLVEVMDEKGQISKKAITTRLKELARDKEAVEEYLVLKEYEALINSHTDTKSHLKSVQDVLKSRIAEQYGKLTEEEIKIIVVEDKWLAKLSDDLKSELNRISQTLSGRIKQLADRYATPLPQLTGEVSDLTNRVETHLRRMGFIWN